jgi:hypothetical protein
MQRKISKNETNEQHNKRKTYSGWSAGRVRNGFPASRRTKVSGSHTSYKRKRKGVREFGSKKK